MQISLNQIEARILGAFIEKELTTPDYYPLSLNGLTNACNQKSNRAPVMQLSEAEVIDAVDHIRKMGLAMQSQDAGSRVTKYRHSLRERLYLENLELAILAELLLRGPQTPGELRARADRMASFPDLEQVDQTLQELMDKEPPFVVRLDRQPGRREQRYAQLLYQVEEDEPPQCTNNNSIPLAEGKSIAILEEEITQIKADVNALREELSEFRKQFE